MQALRHHRPHIAHGQQLFHCGGLCGGVAHDGAQTAKVFGQVFGRGFAHVANAQTKEKTGQRGVFGLFQCNQQVFGRQGCHAVQVGQRQQPQAVQVGQHLDDVAVHQLLHQLVAEAFHLHRPALSEMQDGLLALRTTEQAPGAAGVHLAFLSHRGTATHGAVGGCGVGLAALGLGRAIGGQATVGPGHHAHHLGNDIARAAHDDGVPHPHVFAAGLVFVVQGGVGHRHPSHKHGRQLGHRREFAGATHLHVNAQHGGELLLRRVFVRHGPAWLAGDKAQGALQIEPVDLVHRAVNVKRQLVALGTQALVKRQQICSTQSNAGKRGDRKTPQFQGLQPFKVGGQLWPAVCGEGHLAQAIGKKAQRALRSNGRVKLAHRTRCGVARVDKGFFALGTVGNFLPLAFVQRVEVVAAHVHLASHLQHGGHWQNSP